MIKKALSVFLSLVICLSIFPTTAYAKDGSTKMKTKATVTSEVVFQRIPLSV